MAKNLGKKTTTVNKPKIIQKEEVKQTADVAGLSTAGTNEQQPSLTEQKIEGNGVAKAKTLKDKKKKGKKGLKSAIFKRKLTVDPKQGEIGFSNFNPKVIEKKKLDKKLRDEEKKKKEKGSRSGSEDEEDDDEEEKSDHNSNQSDSTDNEDFPDYKEKGYHPVHLGELMDSKYLILKKLGWGYFSTVWLAFNVADKKLYALKIIKSHKKYLESAYDEEAICKIIAENYNSSLWAKAVRQYLKNPQLNITKQNTHCLQMNDWFNHYGIHGQHFTMVFEVLGKNLLALMKKHNYRGIPIPLVREITKQILMGLDYMHRVCKLIHTDLKPENITFQLKEEEEFDLLYKYVLSTPLIDIYEAKEKIILNKKQAKNQKKKDRKKKKKAGGKKEEESKKDEDDEDEEEDKEEDKNTQEATVDGANKTNQLIEQMRKKIEEKEKEYFVPKFKRDASEEVFRKHARFERVIPLDDSVHLHPQRKMKNEKKKEYLRIRSQEKLHSDRIRYDEIRPLDEYQLKRIKDIQFKVKLVDMGNACYTDNKFSDIIQTRQYRSPEVIVRADYDQSADLWSLACTVFELITGDYLFEPKKGKKYSKNEDHMALIAELIGPCQNKNFLLKGYKSDKIYDKNGELRNIKKLKFWNLYDVLIEKYRIKDFEAKGLADFINKILKWEPKDRPSAQEMLDHSWLKMRPNYDSHMSRRELREFMKCKGYSVSSSRKSKDNEEEEKKSNENGNNISNNDDEDSQEDDNEEEEDDDNQNDDNDDEDFEDVDDNDYDEGDAENDSKK